MKLNGPRFGSNFEFQQYFKYFNTSRLVTGISSGLSDTPVTPISAPRPKDENGFVCVTVLTRGLPHRQLFEEAQDCLRFQTRASRARRFWRLAVGATAQAWVWLRWPRYPLLWHVACLKHVMLLEFMFSKILLSRCCQHQCMWAWPA